MSYDLMVFAPAKVPRQKAYFLEWYENQTEWEEDHSYDDPEVTDPALQNWFTDAIREYPALNGPHASDDFDNPKLTDYCIGKTVIYCAFAWSVAEEVRGFVFDLARKHRVGFFDVSSDDGGVWLLDENGGYSRIF